ncbi:MAG: CoB--CoM heterodisulfide reductase iron-sulfur subunit B family protein [Firmicutes bacterium]|nr:CoB--CoM heterodisulfide reductase iron-sulfur subunit B family protein [Bacillota bacterium]
MVRYAYYPGCAAEGSGREYEMANLAVASRLGLELVEMEDWTCCGATPAHGTSHLLGLALPARNLALASDAGLDVVAPCAACYNRLVSAQREIACDPELQALMGRLLGREYRGDRRVLSMAEAVAAVGAERIRALTVRTLEGVKVACYYGCLLVRPPAVMRGDDPEDPRLLDDLLRGLGAATADWAHKTECCGAAHAFPHEEVVLQRVRRILEAAAGFGVDCIATACPLCHANLDQRQARVNRRFGTRYRMPVVYFTQLIGLALGLDPAHLGLDRHFVPTAELVRKIA